MMPEINQEHFWEAIAVNECDLLGALKNNQFTTEKANNIAKTYKNIGQVAASARQMRPVIEHVEFLCSMTVQLKIKQADSLLGLAKGLRRMH